MGVRRVTLATQGLNAEQTAPVPGVCRRIDACRPHRHRSIMSAVEYPGTARIYVRVLQTSFADRRGGRGACEVDRGGCQVAGVGSSPSTASEVVSEIVHGIVMDTRFVPVVGAVTSP